MRINGENVMRERKWRVNSKSEERSGRRAKEEEEVRIGDERQ